MAHDRSTIINIFQQLNLKEYKTAAGALDDHGIEPRDVDEVKNGLPDDMAALILKRFDNPKRKMVIRNILEQARCPHVIRKYEQFLSNSSPQDVGMSDAAAATSASNNPPSYPQAVLNKRNALYDNLNKELGKDEEHRLRGLLDGCQLKKGELEKLRDVADILKELDRQGCFTPNYKFLESLLDQIGRAPLKRYIREYELGLNN